MPSKKPPVKKKTPVKQPVKAKPPKIYQTPLFGKVYLGASIFILVATVVYWSVLGAKIQLSNADSLVNAYLFKSSSVFHGATFPGQHTLLLKWPLFLLLRLLGFSNWGFISLTVLLVLATVFGLVFILSKIERRKLVLGTICLALASVLLLVPAQAYAGGLLPVNLAMITSRNIEYIFFIGSLILVARSPKLKNKSFWLAVILMIVLLASDKLFLNVGLGASGIVLLVYALLSHWEMVSFAARWLLAQAIAAVGALGLLGLINASHLTHISNLTSAGPYGLSNLHDVILGGLYGLLGLLTNLGANPAYDATIVRNLPRVAFDRLFSLSGPALVINLLLAAAGIYAACRLILGSLLSRPAKAKKTPAATEVAIMLIWTSLVTLVLFVFSNHNYAVDARYLTIALFAVFIAVAVLTRQRAFRARHVLGIGALLIVAAIFGVIGSAKTYDSEKASLATVNNRNADVAAVVKNHPTYVLVGNYWRVIPIMHDSSKLNVMPLTNCSQPRGDLSSSAWQPNLNTHSFTYLLSYDKNVGGFPSCSLNQVINAFGRPNASVVIAGTPDKPKEQLLFYDHGIHKSAPTTPQPPQGPSTVVPISLDQLPYVNCEEPTLLTVVAHQDDDLLFMNPDILKTIQQGYCVRTVYVTSGDAGEASFYWLSREQGSEAAYAQMTGDHSIWVNRIIQLADNEFISVANPRGNSKVSLIFMHLPDGGTKGQGFKDNRFESLVKLYNHQIDSLQSVDGTSSYSYDQFVRALVDIMGIYSPAEIFTQSTFVGQQYQDHSDHNTVGHFVDLAYDQYEKAHYNDDVMVPIHFYMGYPIHGLSTNVSDGDLQTKQKIFMAYAQHDPNVCQSTNNCQLPNVYKIYLAREYQNPF